MAINTDAVQRLYVAYFNRPADPAGLTYWEGLLPSTAATQAQLAAIAAGFSGSQEYAALYAGQTDAEIVNSLYTNLFGRAAEPAGLTHWAGRLTAGSETVASLALQLTYSAQGTDAAVIANKLAAASTFTAAINTTAEILAYDGMAAAAEARAWLAQVPGGVWIGVPEAPPYPPFPLGIVGGEVYAALVGVDTADPDLSGLLW